uniref:Ig-like domain-containing protein n=1 Tax=Angiostrongylus cantonensis TaxID=6313 RepID=A0A0K0DQE4_ANGCA
LKGSPLITRIIWLKNGEDMRPDGNVYILADNTLSISAVKELDKGRYTCTATTRVGKAFDEAEIFVVEDINECDEEQRCEYQCENTSGSYNCICPRGYELDNNLRCLGKRKDENQKMCGGLVEQASGGAFLMALLEGIIIRKDNGIGKVTVYDRSGSALEDTVFAISDTESGLKLGSTKSGPFSIRSRRGEAVVYTSSRQLPPGSIYYLRVRARSHSSNHPDSHFMLIISTGMYPF